MSGRFISLEGGEGVGKSTQIEALKTALTGRGIECLVTREPGGSPGAETIRQLLLTGASDRWNSRAEALLFAAARSDHVEKTIRPALERGCWVISDRFLDSSLAYQGVAGQLGSDHIRALHDFGSEGFLPDRTLILMIDGEQGMARARARDSGAEDRIGGRSANFHEQVALGFRRIATEEPDRVRLVDGSGTRDEVTARLLNQLVDLLP